jgi:hypothetical protein
MLPYRQNQSVLKLYPGFAHVQSLVDFAGACRKFIKEDKVLSHIPDLRTAVIMAEHIPARKSMVGCDTVVFHVWRKYMGFKPDIQTFRHKVLPMMGTFDIDIMSDWLVNSRLWIHHFDAMGTQIPIGDTVTVDFNKPLTRLTVRLDT